MSLCLQAVSSSLAGALSRQRKGHQSDAASVPLLFALCSAGQQQGRATCSFQYRVFQLSQVPRRSIDSPEMFPSLILQYACLWMCEHKKTLVARSRSHALQSQPTCVRT